VRGILYISKDFILHQGLVVSQTPGAQDLQGHIPISFKVMGHPDSGEASKADFMLHQVSAIEHFPDTNGIEDVRGYLDVILMPGFCDIF
jgi:hypothetical protein